MRQIALCLLCLALVSHAYAGAEVAADWKVVEAQNDAAREKFSKKLPKLKAVKLFRIDPGATRRGVPTNSPRFHDWVVAASAAPSDFPSEATISGSLATIVASHDNGVAACFEPNHGLTIADGSVSFDVVLCFECSRYIVYGSDGAIVFEDSFTARGEKEKWEQVFRDAGLANPSRQ